MSQFDDKITELTGKVTAQKTVIDSGVTLINGIASRVAAAVAAALAAGATPAQLQALTDLGTAIDAETVPLATAISANTPGGPVVP